MSATATISYKSLRSASSEAGQVARKLTTYANNLERDIYRKLTGYSGEHTVCISTAQSSTNAKMNELRKKAEAFDKYKQDLSDLREKCESTDRAVKDKVSSLTASFKEAHGISNSKVQNTINYILTSITNRTAAGRWLNHAEAKRQGIKDYIKQKAKKWWNYEGGKQLVKSVVISTLEIVGAVCAVIAGVAAFIAGGTVFAIVAAAAGIIGGAIAIVNGVFNIVNEGRAYHETNHNNDPAMGRRRSNEDTWQDWLRRERDTQFAHNLATGIDVVNFACTVISVVDGIGNLLKNGYKWATGSLDDIKNIKMKDILTKDNFSAFVTKVKTSIGNKLELTEIGKAIKNKDFVQFKVAVKNGFGAMKIAFKNGVGEIKNALRTKDFTNIRNFAIDFRDDFKNSCETNFGLISNLKEFADGYKDFSSVEKGAETIGNWAGAMQTLVEGDFSPETILKDGLWGAVIYPNLGLAPISTVDSDTGQVKHSWIKYGDVTGSVSSLIHDVLWDSEDEEKEWKFLTLFGDDDGRISKSVMKKLNQACNFSISIPTIYVPEIKIPTVNVSGIKIKAA